MNFKEKAISFIFPVLSKEVGGVQTLIVRLIEYYLLNTKLRIHLYDYQEGMIRKILQSKKIEGYFFVSLDSSKKYIENYDDETFIITNSMIYDLPFSLRKQKNVTFLVWDVYYPFWNNLNRFFVRIYAKQLVKILVKKNGIVFMEESGVYAFFNILKSPIIQKKIIPIPFKCDEKKKKNFSDDFLLKKQISFGYIGRAVSWKIGPLVKFATDLDVIKGYNFFIYIFTENKEKYIEKFKDLLNIKIIFIEGVFGDLLQKKILEKVDIGVSMGTSALEFASLCIPTILIDFGKYEDFPLDYKYRWIHDANRGELGFDVRDTSKSSVEKRFVLAHELPFFFDNYAYLAKKSSNHVLMFHNLSLIALELSKTADESSLTVKDFKKKEILFFVWIWKLKRIFMKKVIFSRG